MYIYLILICMFYNEMFQVAHKPYLYIEIILSFNSGE